MTSSRKKDPGTRKPLTIVDMQAIASERGGRCLSAEYVRAKLPLEWECAAGHRWQSSADNVKQGAWCRTCATQRRAQEHSHAALAELEQVARERGGRCLSARYVNAITPVEWECAEGHRWFANPANVRRGTWCRLCAFERSKLSLADFQEIAEKRGGRCLSDTYVDSVTELLFECSAGHRWEARPSNVRSGQWCPECRYVRRRTPIEKMQDYATSRGGQCLSDAYTGNKQRLRWRCANGHEWDSSINLMFRKQWCHACWLESSRTGLDRMREIAAEHGGQCLSEHYVNSLRQC